uniref:Secreted protein n=1 Tax=Rhipicephalus appendiculatus TaxID=34631 RepID=A0A131YCQ1_RHIAP
MFVLIKAFCLHYTGLALVISSKLNVVAVHLEQGLQPAACGPHTGLHGSIMWPLTQHQTPSPLFLAISYLKADMAVLTLNGILACNLCLMTSL